MNREQAEEFVKDQLEAYLKRKGIDTGEPFACLNPDHRGDNPSMIYDQALRKVHCFGCHASFDIFALIGLDYHLTEPVDILNKAYELYRIKLQKMEMERPGFKLVTNKSDETAQDYTDYIQQAHERVGETDYFRRRGISPAVIDRFSLGYEPDFTTKDGTGLRTWQAGIIPTSRFTYTARNMDPQAQPTERIRKRGGSSPLFNPQALHSGKPVFIVEGELDALSLVEVGAEATALASPSNTEPFIDYIKRYPPGEGLILSLDNDSTGQETARKLAQELKALAIPFSQVNVSDPYNDPNEALTSNREAFARAVQDALRALNALEAEAAENGWEEYGKTCASYYIGDFLDGIAGDAATSCVSTGFEGLDLALGGGMFEGLYILEAYGSAGKTALVMQIADRLAGNGHDVLDFSLETARRELMARSLSRLTFTESGNNPVVAKTARDITAAGRYESFGQEEQALIASSLETYRGWADRIYINEGGKDMGVEQIRGTIAQHLRFTGRRPVVIVDCLQLLAWPEPEADAGSGLIRTVLELKRISRDYRIPVWAVSNLDQPTADCLKPGTRPHTSGPLQYSADVIMGLQAQEIGAREDLNMKVVGAGIPRPMELTIWKNRHGIAGSSIRLDFYPYFHCFMEGRE